MLSSNKHFVRAVAISVSALFMISAFARQPPLISQQELVPLMHTSADELVILDVRTAAEYAQGHIAGAINVSHAKIDNALPQLLQYRNKRLVVYCRSGRRAGVVEHILMENGFTHLSHLEGDMNAWVKAKLPTVTP